MVFRNLFSFAIIFVIFISSFVILLIFLNFYWPTQKETCPYKTLLVKHSFGTLSINWTLCKMDNYFGNKVKFPPKLFLHKVDFSDTLRNFAKVQVVYMFPLFLFCTKKVKQWFLNIFLYPQQYTRNLIKDHFYLLDNDTNTFIYVATQKATIKLSYLRYIF